MDLAKAFYEDRILVDGISARQVHGAIESHIESDTDSDRKTKFQDFVIHVSHKVLRPRGHDIPQSAVNGIKMFLDGNDKEYTRRCPISVLVKIYKGEKRATWRLFGGENPLPENAAKFVIMAHQDSEDGVEESNHYLSRINGQLSSAQFLFKLLNEGPSLLLKLLPYLTWGLWREVLAAAWAINSPDYYPGMKYVCGQDIYKNEFRKYIKEQPDGAVYELFDRWWDICTEEEWRKLLFGTSEKIVVNILSRRPDQARQFLNCCTLKFARAVITKLEHRREWSETQFQELMKKYVADNILRMFNEGPGYLQNFNEAYCLAKLVERADDPAQVLANGLGETDESGDIRWNFVGKALRIAPRYFEITPFADAFNQLPNRRMVKAVGFILGTPEMFKQAFCTKVRHRAGCKYMKWSAAKEKSDVLQNPGEFARKRRLVAEMNTVEKSRVMSFLEEDDASYMVLFGLNDDDGVEVCDRAVRNGGRPAKRLDRLRHEARWILYVNNCMGSVPDPLPAVPGPTAWTNLLPAEYANGIPEGKLDVYMSVSWILDWQLRNGVPPDAPANFPKKFKASRKLCLWAGAWIVAKGAGKTPSFGKGTSLDDMDEQAVGEDLYETLESMTVFLKWYLNSRKRLRNERQVGPGMDLDWNEVKTNNYKRGLSAYKNTVSNFGLFGDSTNKPKKGHYYKNHMVLKVLLGNVVNFKFGVLNMEAAEKWVMDGLVPFCGNTMEDYKDYGEWLVQNTARRSELSRI